MNYKLFGYSMLTTTSKNSFLDHIASVAQNEIIKARIKIVEEANKCLGKCYSIEEVVDSGFIPFLIECIKMPNEYFQCLSASVLQRIALENFKYCQIMIDDGIVPVLIELLNYKSNADEQDTFYVLLGTLMDRQPLIFDECIKLNLHEKLCAICEKTTFSWPLALLIGVCYPNQELLYCVKRYIFSLKEFSSFNNDGMLEGISHILDYLCKFEKPIQKMVIDCGILNKLVPFIDVVKRKRFSIIILYTFQYISMNEEFANSLFETGILKSVEKLLMSPEVCADKNITEPIAKFIYNIGDNPENIQKIIEANLIYSVIDFVEWSSVKEAFVKALMKLFTNCNSKQAMKIIKMNALSTLFNYLKKVEDLNITENILETFFNVLQKFENVKNVFYEMEEYGIFDEIKNLKNHENQEIREA